jgi:hypothetical protein
LTFNLPRKLQGVMRGIAIIAIMLAIIPHAMGAPNCETMPAGPARTDCYIGMSRLYQGQSDLAAGKARVRSDAARYRQVTGKAQFHSREQRHRKLNRPPG